MRKTDKKIDNQIRNALTQVCELALTEYAGFEWLTHQVNYTNFPSSLKITCVFDSQKSLATFFNEEHSKSLMSLIEKKLKEIGVAIHSKTQIAFDSEENCQLEHQGNWSIRFNPH